MNYHFKIHKEKGGYWGECLELIGCNSQGDTQAELLENLEDALNLYLSEPQDSNLIFPLPKNRVLRSGLVKVEVGPSVAFSFLLRRERLLNKLTMKEMAQKLRYKSINAYAKLELPHKANPGLMTLAKIKKILKEIPLDLILAS